MERRLYEASIGGNLASLMELLQEDQLVLDKAFAVSFNTESPLHIAVMRGHIEFAREVVKIKPEFASELDSQGFSPLHLACTAKNINMVKVLLEADPEACALFDQEGRTPLHLAAMKGQVEIMKMLILTRSEVIQVCLNGGETILHFCVKHNCLEALVFLLEFVHGADEEYVSVNSTDDDGNTILHLAVSRRRTKMINYLVSNNVNMGVVNVNALNNNGFTALDILITQSPRHWKDEKIENLLRCAGGHQTVVVTTTVQSQPQPSPAMIIRNRNRYKDEESFNKYDNWLRKKRNVLMVVASLIATMAFQAGVNPPGGVWQQDNKVNSSDPGTFLYYSQFTVGAMDWDPDHAKPNSSEAFILFDLNKPDNAMSYIVDPPMLVLQDDWSSIISNHTGFFPYLVQYAGTSVMAYKSRTFYSIYTTCNTIGFLASLSIILLLVSGLPLNRRLFVWILMSIMWVAITSMAISYLAAVSSMVPPFYKDKYIYDKSVYVWCGFMGVLLFFHITRLVYWLVTRS
ncbi:hypothetical protein MKW92_040145 [Papaver armeniacum]|nr:hypothetical protein MKW92_040145 [Papaver armeniacum]